MALDSAANRLALQLSARDGRLEVRASAHRGEARAETSAPGPELLAPLARYQPGDYPAAVLAPLGQALGTLLFTGDVGRLAADILGDARAREQSAHVELRFDPDQVGLAAFPWELIRDPLGQYLVRDGRINLTRYIAYPQPPPVFEGELRDRPLLRVTAQPPSLPPLQFDDLGVPRLETLAHASFTHLSQKLLVEEAPCWGLHFDGHGGLVLQCPQCDGISLPAARFCRACGSGLADAQRIGGLAFERRGQVEWVTAADVGAVLYNAHIRLALLLACESARVGDHLLWSGLAPNLVLAGVPAVVGMQYPVYDAYANLFARTFYAALLRRGDVVDALQIARRVDPREAWYSPVLYLRHQPRPAPAAAMSPALRLRHIDTAAPSGAAAGMTFLARLWIRRPETPPLSAAQLRAELDIPPDVPVQTGEFAATVKFSPVPGRALRRGEVEVELTGIGCEVRRSPIKLFVDEDLDAPPAIFVVHAATPGRATLVFAVYQDGGQIASIIHHLDIRPPHVMAAGTFTPLALSANVLPLDGVERRVQVSGPAPYPGPRNPAVEDGQVPPAPTTPATPPALPPSPRAATPAYAGRESVSATALTTGGWALAGGAKTLGGAPPPSVLVNPPLWDLALACGAGLLVAWAIRSVEPRLRAAHLLLIAAVWAVVWIALAPLVDVLLGALLAGDRIGDRALAATLVRGGAGALAGVTGGMLTALTLRTVQPRVGWRNVAAIAAGWAIAFAIAELLSPALGATLPRFLRGAIFWGLIAGTGTAFMLREMASMSRHES